MNYIVTKEKMEQYLRLEIGDNDLFPDEAPSGTSFYDLVPENDEACVVREEHIINLLNKFVDGLIDDIKVKEYVETLIALDLFNFDESNDLTHDLISNVVFTLDELKDVNGEISKEDAVKLRDKFAVRIS